MTDPDKLIRSATMRTKTEAREHFWKRSAIVLWIVRAAMLGFLAVLIVRAHADEQRARAQLEEIRERHALIPTRTDATSGIGADAIGDVSIIHGSVEITNTGASSTVPTLIPNSPRACWQGTELIEDCAFSPSERAPSRD